MGSMALGLGPLLLALLLLGGATALPKSCDQYKPLYSQIERDLGLFKRTGGITPKLMARTMMLHSVGNREKGLAVGFYSGKLYVIDNGKRMNLKPFGHHVTLWAAYLKVMLALEATHGSSLPNVEFMWHTIDRPVRLTNISGGNFPVMRFGKSKAHPDILIPNFHFYMKAYQSSFLDRIGTINRQNPWSQRRQVALARFSAYGRYVHPLDPHTQRLGAGGVPLCKVQGRGTAICPARLHLHQWAANFTDRLDVSKDRHVPMEHHARFRYLLHVDGQGLSSKLEFMLALGSLVLKEESGYEAFYHHMLQPGVHFLPVWKQGSGPEDILEAVDWARAHDDEAHKIALAGQVFAEQYLSAEARECYWLKLLETYGETMTYDPVAYRNLTMSEDGSTVVKAAGLRFIKPALRFLEEDVAAYKPNLLKELVWEP